MFKKPSPKLMRELEEVADIAKKLGGIAGGSRPNLDLSAFPTKDLADLCDAVARLPGGTTDGCREPLIYVRKRLASMRRLHFIPAATGSTDSFEELAVPVPGRGDLLDEWLIQLIGAISTALDQYQSDTLSELVDEYPPEEDAQLADVKNLSVAIERSKKLNTNLTAAVKTTSELVAGGMEKVDDLERQLRDAQIQNFLARSELARRVARPSWYEPLVAQLQRMPEVIEKTGVAIQDGVKNLEGGIAILKPVLDRWKNFKRNALSFLLEEIKETGAALQEIGAEMKALRQERRENIRIDDFNIRLVEEMIVNGKPPPRTWAPLITSLDFSYYHAFASIAPLKGLKALRELSLMNTLVADLTPLSGLSRLEYLDLSYVYVLSDLRALERLHSLRVLKIPGTRVQNISPVSKLPNLDTVYVDLNSEDFSQWERMIGRTNVLKQARR